MDASPDHTHPQVVIERAYAALIRESRRKAYAWGSHDCVLFASAAIRIRSGREVLTELGISPAWKTEAEADEAIAAAGGLRAALTRALGDPIGILQARLGDVALATSDESARELVAVVHGGHLIAPGTRGLAALPFESAKAAWRAE